MPARGRRCPSRRRTRPSLFTAKMKRATFRNYSARRPLARTPVTKRAVWVAWVASASLRCASTATPPKGPSWPSALRNYAGPQHFYLFGGMCSAWVPGSVLGSLNREIEPSLPARSWPLQASVVPLYSVTTVTSRANSGEPPDCYRGVSATTGRSASECETAKQRVRQRACGKCAHADGRGGGDGCCGRRGEAIAQRHRIGERQHRPATRRSLFAQ
jgi:hypothetical protein